MTQSWAVRYVTSPTVAVRGANHGMRYASTTCSTPTARSGPPRRRYTGAVEVVANYGDALAGKILVDFTNPFNADVSGLATTAGDSVSRQIAVAPRGHTRRESVQFNLPRRPFCSRQAHGRVLRRRQRRGEGTPRGVSRELGHFPLYRSPGGSVMPGILYHR